MRKTNSKPVATLEYFKSGWRDGKKEQKGGSG
jgi:hypothetical protein